MLFDWALGTTILLSVILGAFVASFLLDNILTFRSNRYPSDDPIEEAFHQAREERGRIEKRMYQQIAITYLMQILNSLLTVTSFAFEVPSMVVHAFRVITQNRQIVLLVIFSSIFAIGLFENGPLLLEKFDGLYSCVITPFVNNIVFSVMNVFNIFYVTFIPIYNVYISLIKQMISGTFLIATKCATSSLTLAGFVQDSVAYFTEICTSALKFTGITDNNFATSNMLYNEFNVYTVHSKLRNLFRFIPETFSCFCKATSGFSNLIFYGSIISDRFDWIFHHSVNAVISFLQVFARVVPPLLEYPNFDKTFFHIINVYWEFALLIDEWIFEAINTVLTILNIDGGIIIDRPKIFVFEATFGHLFAAMMQIAKTTVDAISHVVLPFDTTPITNTKYMASLFKMDEAFTHINLFVHSQSHVVTWSMRVLIEILLSKIWMNRCATINVPGACVNYVNSQCSVSCISSNKIRIHDISIDCLYRPDASNRYKHQENIFDKFTSTAAFEYAREVDFYESSTFLPLEDKNIFLEIRKMDSLMALKISYPEVTLLNSNIKDVCQQIGRFDYRESCYKNTLNNIFLEAYGARGAESVYSSVGCSAESALFVPINTLQTLYSFSIDYFWFNFINYFRGEQTYAADRVEKMKKNGEEFRALLRAYSGPWFGRDYEPPCKVYYNVSKPAHFATQAQYEDYLTANNDKCKQVNLNEHVFFHMDRVGYYLFANIFEKQTFGKILFNVYRLFVEQLRILIRLEAEGYGLYPEIRRMFVDGSTIGEKSTELFRTEIGCHYNYGNTTNEMRGYCSNSSFALNAQECDPFDNTLNVTTECGCIENPNIDGNDFQEIAERNTRFYTTKAISKWCSVNLWDFNYIFLARAINGVRNFITALSPKNLEQGFPPIDNICDTESYQYSQSTTIETIFDNTCTVLAYQDFFCPTGELLQRVFLTLTRFLRKEQRNFFRFFGLRFSEVDMTINDQVCDAQNALMAASNMVSSLFVKDVTVQKPFTRLIFSVANLVSIPLEFGILGLRTLRAFIAGDARIIDNGASDGLQGLDISKVRDVVMKSLSLFIGLFTKHIIDLCESFSGFLNTIVPCSGSVCAGSIFDVIALIAGIVESITKDVALATVLDIIELVARLIQALVSSGDMGKQEYTILIEKMVQTVSSIVELLASNASLWLSFLFDTLLGPVGDIIKAVQSAICSVLQVDFIKNLLSVDTSFCAGVTTTTPSSSSSSGGGGSVISDVGNFLGGIFSRRRRLLGNSSVLYDAATKIDWEGTSRCDQIILAYKDYDLEKMSPLEKIDWGQCLYYRLSMEIVEKKYNVGLPHDLMYNWLRKYTVAFDASIASYLYFSWWMQSKTQKELKIMLSNNGYDPQKVNNAVGLVHKLLYEFASWKNIRKSLNFAFSSDNDKTKGERVYINLRSLHSHVTTSDWSSSMVQAQKAMHKFVNDHLSINAKLDLSGVQVFSSSVQNMLKIYTLADKNTFGDMYGAFTNLQCPKDSLICLDCAFIDNFLYNSIYQFQDAAQFYRHDVTEVILPEFVEYWENTSSYNARYTKAYRRAFAERLENRFGGTMTTTQPFGDFLGGFFNGTYSTADFFNGISYFLQGNYTGTIPPDAVIIFPNDLQYYLELPFQSSCDTAEWRFNSFKDNVGNGIWSVFMLNVGVQAFFFFVGSPNFVTSAAIYLFLAIFQQYLYLFVTYDYNPVCTGVLPSYLVKDFLNWLDDNVFLDCACSYVPYLSVKPCEQQTCDVCDINTSFHDCRDLLPAFRDLGYFYHFVFIFRWYFPEQFKYLGNLRTWPFPYIFSNTGFSKLLSDVERDLKVTGTEENCFFLHLLSPISILVILYLSILATIPVLSIVIRTVKESISMFINTVLVLYYLSKASNS